MSSSLSRRSFLVGAASACIAPASAAPAPLRSLGEAAGAASILFGASISQEALDNPAYGALYAEHARILTTDRALKFDALRPNAATFDFAEADALLAFAQARGLPMRGHALIWNENAPGWLRGLSAREVARVFDAHIERVASRYAGRLHSWDVVNEPFWPLHGQPGGFRDGPWLAAFGPAYVERALRRVAAVDPKARAVINEAHCEIDGEWGRSIRPRLLMLVDRLLDAGAPLHAIGLQGHLQPQWSHDDEYVLRFIERIAERGLDVYISEFDVNDGAFPDDPAARDARVAERYRDFLGAVLRAPAVKIVETWQLSDRYSWYRDQPEGRKRQPRPLPFDAALRPKPAAHAMREAFLAAAATR